MNNEITPPTTQESAVELLNILMTSDSQLAKLTAYDQLKQLICLLIPK